MSIKKCIQKNQFIIPSYQLYNYMAGFQTYGINGVKLKNKLLDLWRSMFIDSNIVEIETPSIMPYNMLLASGHVDRFTDYVITNGDKKFRADNIVKDYFGDKEIEDINGWKKDKLESVIIKHKILGNIKVEVKEENLMFPIDGGFLRPELAGGMFVNYGIISKYLKKYSDFGIANIGRSYRREISPIQFIRMREFTQAEIEYFVDPQNKSHPLFNTIKNIKIPIENNIMITIKDIKNETIGYFLSKVYVFVLSVGMDKNKIRFRKHSDKEMAHYANECWDLEALVDGKWLECVGIADRGSYDLKAHSHAVKLIGKRKLKEPIIIKKYSIKIDKKLVGSKFRKLTPLIITYLNNMKQSEIMKIKDSIIINDSVLTKDMFKVIKISKKITYEEYYPHVIEPSFGIDRIIYTILNHNYRLRDKTKFVLSIPYYITPYEIAIFALHNKKNMNDIVNVIFDELKNDYSCYADDSSVVIGKKYIRSDELGIKYAITVDLTTIYDNTVTLRDRDTTKQIRVKISNLANMKCFK